MALKITEAERRGPVTTTPEGRITAKNQAPPRRCSGRGHGHRRDYFDDARRVQPMTGRRSSKRRLSSAESPYYTTLPRDEWKEPISRRFISMSLDAEEAYAYWKSRAEREFVYFVRQLWDDLDCEGDPSPVKIGFAADPIERVAGLQTGNPHKLCIMAVISGDRHTEKRLHAKWAGYRMRGEWFAKEVGPPIVNMASAMSEIQIKAHKAGESREAARYAAETAFIDNQAARRDFAA